MTKKKPRSVNFLPEAEQDLKEIGQYSAREWGRAQARSYVKDIRKACRRLVNYPYFGPSFDHIREGYRGYGVHSHIIYYRYIEHTRIIEVVRILHVRMDARRHLQSL